MAHIKRFFESIQNPEYTIEDFEDIFLELMDMGFKILEFDKKYINPKTGEPNSRPQQGNVLGYNMLITAEATDDEEDYNDDGRRVRHSNFDYIQPLNLAEIQEDFQRIKALYPIVISCLKNVDVMGKLIVESFPRPSYFRISVIPKGEVASVSEREEEYHSFCSAIDRAVGETLSHERGEYKIEKDPKEETIKIKFGDNLTRGRFTTAINNIRVLKTGAKNYRIVRQWIYDFEITSSFISKSAEIKFKSGKRRLS